MTIQLRQDLTNQAGLWRVYWMRKGEAWEMSRYAVSFQVCPWCSGNRKTRWMACTVKDTGKWGSVSKASLRLTSSPEMVDIISFRVTDGKGFRQVSDLRVPRPVRSQSSSWPETRVLDYAWNTEFFSFNWKADCYIVLFPKWAEAKVHRHQTCQLHYKKEEFPNRQTRPLPGLPLKWTAHSEQKGLTTRYLMQLHFPKARHLPYGYEISFADSIRLNENVHKVFFALERLRTWMLRLVNWANAAVTHRCPSSLKRSKCKRDRQSE